MSLTKKKWETYQNEKIFQFIRGVHDVYSVQHYEIKFVSDLWQVGGFLRSTPVFSSNKTDRHDIAEILLKVELRLLIANRLEVTADTNR
jgi:hypothetical protein